MAIRRLMDPETGEQIDVDLDDEQPVGEPEKRTNAEWAAKRKAEQRADKAEKELAFLRAGIDLDDPKVKWFVKGYDGKTDPAEIKAAATEAGIVAAPAEPSAPVLDQTDTATLDAQNRMNATAAGARPDVLTDEARLEQAMAAGGVEAMLQQARVLGVRVAGPQ